MASVTKQLYQDQVVATMRKNFGYANIFQVPKVEKIVLNVGVGTRSNYNIDYVADNLSKITGQAPIKAFAKKSISNFKIREGQPIGLKVTLRGKRMYEFLDRLIHVTLPRIHDFRGLPADAFDKQGNYTIGMRDQLAFPEITAASTEQLHGLEITIVTTATNSDEAYELLLLLGMPLQVKKSKKSSNKFK